MKYLFSCLATMAWALWLGGLVTLFISVTALFAHSHDLAVEAAPVLFLRFEKYQLALAAGSIAAMLLWQVQGSSRSKTAILLLMTLAAGCAAYSTASVTPAIERLRAMHQTQTDEFRSLHGRSMVIYLSETILLAMAGVAIPAAVGGGESIAPARTENARQAEAALR